MKKNKLFNFLLLSGVVLQPLQAQTTSASSNLIAQPVPDRSISFGVADAGVSKPMTWGLDLAWLSESNLRRGIAFMGSDKVDYVRSSFTPTDSLINGDLKTAELTTLNQRLALIALLGANTKVVLNCDHPSVSSWYIGKPARWAQLIDVTTRRHQEKGRQVESVSPFNEPDYGWGQYSGTNGKSDFYNIATELRKISRFDTIRICGGNTLNCDQALSWYNYLKPTINEGNTHQLAGTFDNFASFFQTVRTNGHHATGDELHNVMEPMVGVEYGMQTGIWWGTAELARGEFVKASYGVRLGYAEHRTNWTAASVYRNAEGKVQAFAGTSERQAFTTTYRYVSKDRDVYYDGYGPQREYTLVLPGGTAYQTGQTNAERVVNITWGDDIQPAINGKYMLVNRNSGKVMEVTSGSTVAGAYIRQNTNTGATYQQWNVTPVDSRIGGDFSYFTFTAVHSGKALDLLNYSLDNGSNVIAWDDAKGANQQWYLEYAGDGWFYIRSRHSAKCLDVYNNSTSAAYIVQKDKSGANSQQWRFMPVGTTIEFTAPSAPANLTATPNAESVRLDWAANTETDLNGYNVYRAETAGGSYSTLARNLTNNSFVDNTALSGQTYYYCVKAVDKALNRSVASNEVTGAASGVNDIIANYKFESITADSSSNLNHAAAYTGVSYTTSTNGSKAASFDGSTGFVQLPATIANHQEMTISAWVYWNSITSGQQIFNFGNDATQYMYLTPRASSGKMRFAIKNGGTEQTLAANALPYFQWAHVAVTIGSSGVKIYTNGVLSAQSTTVTIRPNDFKPVLNYLARSQSTDPLFNGNIDDFRIYNYALSDSEIAKVAGIATGIDNQKFSQNLSIWPQPANDILYLRSEANVQNVMVDIYSLSGKLIWSQKINHAAEMNINISTIPTGIYMLKMTDEEQVYMKKLIISK